MDFIFHADKPAIADKGDELSIQIRLRKAIKERLRDTVFIAVPNGAERTAWAAIKAKHEGMKSGFPDGLVIWDDGIAFVEIKTASGSLSPNQIEWLNWLTRHGHKAGMFRSVETCMEFLIASGAPVKRMAA